jgi:hypothetical protein
MFEIVLHKRSGSPIDDRWVASIGPRRLKTCDCFESAILPPFNVKKLFKTEADARRALRPWINEDGTPGDDLTAAGFVAIEIRPAYAPID